MLAVNPKYIGETIDMKTCDDFSFVNASGMASAIETVTSDDPETLATILAGEMTVSREGEYTDVKFDVTGRDEIRFHGSVGIHTPKPQKLYRLQRCVEAGACGILLRQLSISHAG